MSDDKKFFADENPYAPPTELNDSTFYCDKRVPDDGDPPFGRVLFSTFCADSFRFFVGRWYFFVPTFLFAFAFFGGGAGALLWNDSSFPHLVFILFLFGLLGGALSLVWTRVAFRLAKTGSHRRRADSNEREFSKNYFLVGFLCETIWTAIVDVVLILGAFATDILPFSSDVLTLSLYGIYSAILFRWATSNAFFPFVLAERRLGFFKAFRWSRRCLRKAIFPFWATFALLWGVSLTSPVFIEDDEARLRLLYWYFSLSFATYYLFWTVGAPVAYLLTTGRRLYCDRKENQ